MKPYIEIIGDLQKKMVLEVNGSQQAPELQTRPLEAVSRKRPANLITFCFIVIPNTSP